MATYLLLWALVKRIQMGCDSVDRVAKPLKSDSCVRDVEDVSEASASIKLGHAVVVTNPPHSFCDLRRFLSCVVATGMLLHRLVAIAALSKL